MPQQSKYELASPEVQEVMTKPPHLLILWGNTFILLIIAICLVLLNTVTIPRYVWFSYRVMKCESQRIIIVAEKNMSQLQVEAKMLQLPAVQEQAPLLSFTIQSIQINNAHQSIITATAGTASSGIKSYGEGKVLAGRLSILDCMLQQFHKTR